MVSREVLVLPGWQNSSEVHWQTRWERRFGWKRVTPEDWFHPRRADWVDTLARAVRACEQPPLIVAHSLGVTTTVLLGQTHPAVPVAGAFLVAAPDLERADTPPEILNFLPVPAARLNFPSLLVSSANDPLCSPARAREFATAWGSEFADAGARGHLGELSGVHDWENGLKMFERWAARI